jgi:hypothetical protein
MFRTAPSPHDSSVPLNPDSVRARDKFQELNQKCSHAAASAKGSNNLLNDEKKGFHVCLFLLRLITCAAADSLFLKALATVLICTARPTRLILISMARRSRSSRGLAVSFHSSSEDAVAVTGSGARLFGFGARPTHIRIFTSGGGGWNPRRCRCRRCLPGGAGAGAAGRGDGARRVHRAVAVGSEVATLWAGAGGCVIDRVAIRRPTRFFGCCVRRRSTRDRFFRRDRVIDCVFSSSSSSNDDQSRSDTDTRAAGALKTSGRDVRARCCVEAAARRLLAAGCWLLAAGCANQSGALACSLRQRGWGSRGAAGHADISPSPV